MDLKLTKHHESERRNDENTLLNNMASKTKIEVISDDELRDLPIKDLSFDAESDELNIGHHPQVSVVHATNIGQGVNLRLRSHQRKREIRENSPERRSGKSSAMRSPEENASQSDMDLSASKLMVPTRFRHNKSLSSSIKQESKAQRFDIYSRQEENLHAKKKHLTLNLKN
jgi:hypothetical protein